MVGIAKFTKTEQAMLDVLRDGNPHPRQQLIDCVPNGQGTRQNVTDHVRRIRLKLAVKGQTIVCVWRNRQVWYQQVINLSPHDE